MDEETLYNLRSKLVKRKREEGKMRVAIKRVFGPLLEIDVTSSTTVGEIKERIHGLLNVPTSIFYLKFQEVHMEQADEDKALTSFGVRDGSTLHMMLRLKGD